jgi:tetratricopeptide (TPR) repeat protein
MMHSLHLRFTILLIASLSLPILCFGQANGVGEAQLERLSETAQAAQQRGDYAAAAKAYEQLAELRPGLGEIWANAALMHQFAGDYARAEHDFQTALSKNSKLYVPNLFLGLNRLRLRQPRAALPYLKIAVSLNHEDEQAVMGLGRAYSGIRDYENAAQQFERAREINPKDSDAWYELGVSYLNLQHEAVSQLERLDPGGAHARALVADSFVSQGRAKDAIQIYEKFQAQDDPPCLRSELGFASLQAGAADKAKAAFDDEISHRPGCLLARLGLARLALAAGDPGAMLHQLHEVQDRDSRFFHASLPRLWTGLDADQVKTLTTELQQPASTQDPLTRQAIESANADAPPPDSNVADPATATRNIANASPQQLWSEGRYGACAEKIRALKTPRSPAQAKLLERCSFYAVEYRRSLEASRRAQHGTSRDVEALYWQAKSAQELSASSFAQMKVVAPDSPKVHLLMANLHRAREEYPAAEAEYRDVLQSTSAGGESVSAHLGLADVYAHALEDDKALEEVRAVLKSDPANAEANALLGRVLVRRHQFDDAIPALKLALQNPSTSSPEVHSLLAKCYSERGEYSRAVAELRPILADDTMGTFHYQLYQAYVKLGDQKSAAAALQKSEELRKAKARAEQQHTESNAR